MQRLEKLRTSIAEQGLDAVLVSQPENIRYLSGFTGSSGWLLISPTKAILATDFRYTEQAKRESTGFEIFQIKQDLHSWLPGLVADLGCHKLGFEANSVSYETYRKLTEAIQAKQIHIELAATTGLVERIRSVKEPEELKSIMHAAELADAAFEKAKTIIRPGMTEKEAAWQIEKLLREAGSEELPFEIILASGANAALPHARSTDKAIQLGEPVLIDMGARINGYCSDFTRTLFLGAADKSFREIYNIVLKAQCTAIERIEAGMAASQADRLARSVIEEAGYGGAFGHGLGHGVGLAVHELPTLNATSSDLLVEGMVFTVEPGIYLAGQAGVRIEDMVVLENGRARVLTKAKKDPVL